MKILLATFLIAFGFRNYVQAQSPELRDKLILTLESFQNQEIQRGLELSGALMREAPANSDIYFIGLSLNGMAKVILEDYNAGLTNLSSAIKMADKIKPVEVSEATLSFLKAQNYFIRANAYLNLRKLGEACADYKIAEKLGKKEATAILQNYCN